MSVKSESYILLDELNLSPSELERAKARIRARKTSLQKSGLNLEQATIAAVAAERERYSGELKEYTLPVVPENSGLAIRGSKTGKGNPLHWSFTYFDAQERKKKRIPFDKIPYQIVSKFPDGIEETIDLKRMIEREQSGILERIEKIQAFIAQNKEHDELQKNFISSARERRTAKGRKITYGNETTALRVISEYFLNPTENHYLPDVRQWSLHYDDFVEYLQTRTSSRNFSDGSIISKNTQKNYISALNKYVSFVWRKGKIPGQPPKCENYSRSELERRGVESIISLEEEEEFAKYFKHKNLPKVSAFIKIANHIAGRPGEVLGLSIIDVFSGSDITVDPRSTTMKAMKSSLGAIAEANKLEVVGYVRIRGQVDGKSRQPDGTLHYYPSKTVPAVDPKYYRYCPIYQESVWNEIVSLIEIASADEKYGADPANYLLFDELNLHTLQEYFREFRTGRQWEHQEHTPHCCRHTGCTRWVQMAAGDLEAAQKILGHVSIAETRHYDHLLELYAEELDKNKAKDLGVKAFAERFKRL